MRVVAAVIRNDEGRILIAQRRQGDSYAGHWEFPGGGVESTETPEVALARELMEELGVRAEIGNEIFRTHHAFPSKLLELLFFDARILEGKPQCLEVADVRWVTPSELRQFRFPPGDAPLLRLLAGC
jgi:mutator protein MutT